jgi:hypothetical protein
MPAFEDGLHGVLEGTFDGGLVHARHRRIDLRPDQEVGKNRSFLIVALSPLEFEAPHFFIPGRWTK